MSGSFAEISGSFAEIIGSFAEISPSFAQLRSYLLRVGKGAKHKLEANLRT